MPVSATKTGPKRARGHTTRGRVAPPPGEIRLPVVEERTLVGKRKVVTGRVTVHVQPHTRTQTVDIPVADERVRVQRMAVNRVVDRPAPARQEGDTLVVPVYQEIVVVQKKLVLKEEIRITRQQLTTRRRRRVQLRAEEARILRSDGRSAR